MDYLSNLQKIGNVFSELITKIIKYLSELGLNISKTSGKILGLVIVVGLLWVSVKSIEKPLKWVFVSLLIILGVSIISSFLP